MSAAKRRFAATAASASTNARRIAQQARQAFEDRVGVRTGEGQAKFPLHPKFPRCWPRPKKGPRAENIGTPPRFSLPDHMAAASTGGEVFRTRAKLDMAGKGNYQIMELSNNRKVSLPVSRIRVGVTVPGEEKAQCSKDRGRSLVFSFSATWR